MSQRRLTLVASALSAILVLGTLAPTNAHAGAVVLDLRTDPNLDVQGAGPATFAFDASTAAKFPSDASGSLVERFDSTHPSTRAVAALGASYTEADDFVFGAILSIRAAGFETDPFGFHPITFSLINSQTTGFNRTGNVADFRSDTFDTIDVAYFPQVSPFFGGPFLSPAVYGSAVSDDAFADFTFSSTQFELLPGATYLVTAEHSAADRSLVVTVYGLGAGGLPVAIPGGRTVVDLSILTGFSVDSVAITAYEDGFNVFTQSGRSVRADVDYDLLFFAPGSLGGAASLPALAGILRRSGEGARGLSAH
ncbi:MAG: hypothetical protein HY049_11845 [Acidobacteria bacterium]|nr:hypothetical protein [Acidobacteriota bacterium]